MRKLLLGAVGAAAGALLATPVMAGPVACAIGGSVATYEGYGSTGCSIDGGAIVFSNISFTPTVTGSGQVVFTSVTPFTAGNEFGLQLNYVASTGSTPGSIADVAWTYDVSSTPPMIDAYMAFTATTTGDGTATLSEVLTNGGNTVASLSLSSQGSTTQTFAPQSTLVALKDQYNYSGTTGSAETSILQDGFSLATTPIPGTFPLLAGGLIGLFALRRKRKQVKTQGRLQSALT